MNSTRHHHTNTNVVVNKQDTDWVNDSTYTLVSENDINETPITKEIIIVIFFCCVLGIAIGFIISVLKNL
jgi:hypothetical protein